MSSKIKELSKLLSIYEDPELELYNAYNQRLMTEGLWIKIDHLKFKDSQCSWYDIPLKNNVTFFELLKLAFLVIDEQDMALARLIRNKVTQPVLYSDDEILLTFKSKDIHCLDSRKFLIKKAALRYDEQTKEMIKYNFLKFLPLEFLSSVYKNEEVSINIKITKRANYHDKILNYSKLNSSEEYVQELISINSILNSIKQKPTLFADNQLERLELWGVPKDTAKSWDDLFKIIERLPASDFGIKNVTYLRNIIYNFNNNLKSNEELIGPDPSTDAYLAKIDNYLNLLAYNQEIIPEPPRK